MHARTDARIDVTVDEMHTHTDTLMREEKVTGGDWKSRSKSMEQRFIEFGPQRTPKRTHQLTHTPTPHTPHAHTHTMHSVSGLTCLCLRFLFGKRAETNA